MCYILLQEEAWRIAERTSEVQEEVFVLRQRLCCSLLRHCTFVRLRQRMCNALLQRCTILRLRQRLRRILLRQRTELRLRSMCYILLQEAR